MLEQFPHADGNGDGLLDTMEAANLVGGRMAFTQSMAGGEDVEMDVSRRVTVNATEDEVGGSEMTIRINGEEIYNGPSPSQWVEQNLVSGASYFRSAG